MMNRHSKDTAEEALALYEREEKEFRNHWVWKELKCQPEEFFKAVEKHARSLNVSPAEWEKALKKAKETSRTRSNERRRAYRPVNLQLLGSLRI